MSLAARRSDDCSDAWITEGFVEVAEAVLVAAGEVMAEAIKDMLADLDNQAPRGQQLDTSRHSATGQRIG